MYVDNIKRVCQERNISIRDLAKEIGMSFSGLYASLNNNTLKVSTLYDISKVLDVSVETLLPEDLYLFSVEISEFYSNRIVKLSVNRYSKLTDKLNYLKDVYVSEVIWKINNKLSPSYPFVIPGKPEKLIYKPADIKYFETISSWASEIPYSKMRQDIQEYLLKCDDFFEGFYYPVFYLNLYSITEYLNDGLIQDDELMKHWESWKKVKDSVQSGRWGMVPF